MKISELFYSLQGEGKLAGIPSIFIRTSGCNLRCTWCDTPYASWNPEGQNLSIPQILQKLAALSPPNTTPHIVITGGEPMLFPETATLISALKSPATHPDSQINQRSAEPACVVANPALTQIDCLITPAPPAPHITIETAGTLWLDNLPRASIDLLSVSPKLANSTPHTRDHGRFALAHEKNRLNLPLLRHLAQKAHGTILDTQWKFVIATPEDLAEIQSLLAQLNTDLPAAHQIKNHDVLLMPEGIDAATLTQRAPWVAQLCKTHGYRFCPRLHVHLYGNTRAT